MKKKKLAILTLLTLMTMSMIACGNTKNTTESTSKETANNTTELISEVNTTEIDTKQNTEQKTEKSTSFNSKAEELINSVAQLQDTHKDEVLCFKIVSTYEFAEKQSTGEFDMSSMPEDAPGNWEAPVKFKTVVYKIDALAECQYSKDIYYRDIKVIQYFDDISTIHEKSYIKLDTKNKYYYTDTEDKWSKTTVSQEEIDECNPFKNFSVEMFDSYDIRETDKEYIITGKTTVNKLDKSISSLIGSMGVTGSNAKVTAELIFNKNNELKLIDYVIENVSDLDVELKNTELVIDSIHFSNDSLEIPDSIAN